MSPFNNDSLPRRLIRDLETPIIYGLMILVSTIALIVWGMTLVGPRDGGLLKELEPIFGTYYGMTVQAFLMVMMISNRRWIGIAILCAGMLAHTLLVWVSPRVRPVSSDEFWALSPIFALAAICCLLYHHYDSWDRK